jgi:hypothetical protein
LAKPLFEGSFAARIHAACSAANSIPMKTFFSTFFVTLGGFFLISSLLMAQPNAPGNLRGTVLSESGEPLVGASVFIPELRKGAYTNDMGIYSISKVEAGTYEALVSYFGYDTLRREVRILSGGYTTEGFALSERQVYTNSVEITGEAEPGKINKREVDIGVTSITAQEINLIPSLGSADLAQYLQVLPGVVFTGDQGGQLYIRGGTPIQNMVLMDQMVIYSPFHSIGLFSVFDPDYIRKVDVYSAAPPAQFGGRISSVIDIDTRSGSLTETKAKLNVNPFSAGAMVEGPIYSPEGGGAGLSYLVSARNNYIDRTSRSLYGYIDDTVGLPYNFLDLYGKLTLGDGVNRLNLFGFRHTDNVNFEFPANIGWESVGGGGDFQLLPSGAGAIISGGFAYSSYQTSLAQQSDSFPRRSSIEGFNGNLKVSYIFNSVDEFAFGTSFLGFSTDYIFTNSAGLRPSQQASNTEAAVFFNYKKVIQEKRAGGRTFERAVLEPGLHIHYYNNQPGIRLEPRLRGKLNFNRASLSFGTGIYSQNLLAAISDRDVVQLFQGFLSAPTTLPDRIKRSTLQTSWHALAGLQLELIPNLSTTVEGWYKNFTQLTNINRDAQFPTDPDFITETGEAYGLDLILRYQARDLYLYGTYGLARVLRTDRLGEAEPRTYPPNFDRRHSINFVASYKTGAFGLVTEEGRRIRPKFTTHRWEMSLRWNLGSGFPFTQTQGYYEQLSFNRDGAQTDLATQNGQLGVILSDELNGGRLPYYHRLDFSVKRRFVVNNAVLFELDGSAINIYNRQNLFFFDRDRFAPVYQLPFVPTVGLTVKY